MFVKENPHRKKKKSVVFHIETSHLFGQNCVKMFLNDIFLTISKCQLCNYANSNAFYTLGKYKKDKNNMEMHFMILHKWFHKNHMELEPGTCH